MDAVAVSLLGDPPGRIATQVQGARSLSKPDFRRKMALVLVPFVVAIIANGAINGSGLSRNARALASAPFGLLATLFGLASGFLLFGRYVRVGVKRYRIAAGVSAALLGFIILTGSAVRLTGSGLGCPDWPDCKNGDTFRSLVGRRRSSSGTEWSPGCAFSPRPCACSSPSCGCRIDETSSNTAHW